MTTMIALAALSLATPSAAQTVVATTGAPTIAPAAHDNAVRLATVVLPRAETVAVRVPRFEAIFAEDLKDDARMVALEKTHPGITKAVAAAARDEAAKAYGTAIDLLQADVAKLYRDKFTAPEQATLIAFFSSPTGQAMVAMSAGSSGDTASAFETDRRAKAIAYLQNLDDGAKADLTKLIDSGLLPKVRAINPEISALSTRRFDDVSKIIDAALLKRIDATIAAFKKIPQP